VVHITLVECLNQCNMCLFTLVIVLTDVICGVFFLSLGNFSGFPTCNSFVNQRPITHNENNYKTKNLQN